MVSNPSPFSAALKILGILPYSLLLMNLIFFFPLLRIGQVCGLARSNESKLARCRMAFQKHKKSGEQASKVVLYKSRTSHSVSV